MPSDFTLNIAGRLNWNTEILIALLLCEKIIGNCITLIGRTLEKEFYRHDNLFEFKPLIFRTFKYIKVTGYAQFFLFTLI